MPLVSLKPFQSRAVESAIAVFTHMRSVLDQIGDNAEGRAGKP